MILGWLGMAGTFLAYVLLSRGRVSSQSNVYLWLNAVGGTLGGVGSLLYGSLPSAVSNFLWAALSLQPTVWSLVQAASQWQRSRRLSGVQRDEVRV